MVYFDLVKNHVFSIFCKKINETYRWKIDKNYESHKIYY